jgi:protein TonB
MKRGGAKFLGALRLVLCAVLAAVLPAAAIPPAGSGQVDHAAPTQEAAILNVNVCRPAYPRESMRRGEQGVVKMRFTVGVTGHLVGSSVVKSSGFKDLDRAALDALIHCSFRQAYRNGVPVQSTFTMEYKWVLAQ